MKMHTETGRIGRNSCLVLLSLVISLCFTSPLLALSPAGTAPNFTLATLEGKKVSLSDYKGKMVILKLGTTWCPGCRDQDKELQKLDGVIKEAGIVLIKIFLDEPAEDVKHYQQEHPLQTPVVTLLGDDRLMRDYNVYAIPRLIILSAEQKVLADSTGMTAPQIKAQILQK